MKKAVILAGGRGTRLAPITETVPKPLVPFFDKTVIEYILSLLARNGFSHAVVSTMYKSEKIRERLGESSSGISIKYLNEKAPLGTAGGLPTAKKLLKLNENESFLVISGDCVCDFDLTAAIRAHEEKNADATIVSAKVEDPLEYGTVLSDSDGFVRSYNEKPPWAQVRSCRVNTGIYVLNERIIEMIDSQPFDFSHDLFPKMLQKHMRLFEYKADGYWCDIGTIKSYIKCCKDALCGKISGFDLSNSLSEHELSERGIFAEKPFYVSDSANLSKSCKIGRLSIISDGCMVKEFSSISESVLFPNCAVEENTLVKDSLLCRNVKIGKDCVLKNAVVSENTVVEKHFDSVRFRIKNADTDELIFSDDGSCFLGNLGAKPSTFCEILSNAVATALGTNETLGIMCGDDSCIEYFENVLSNASKHTAVINLGKGFLRLASYIAVFAKFDCVIYIYSQDKKVFARLFNRNGNSPSHDFERRVSAAASSFVNSLHRKTLLYAPCTAGTVCFYYKAILDSLRFYCDKGLYGFFAAIAGDSLPEKELFEKALSALGACVLSFDEAKNRNMPIIHLSNGKCGISHDSLFFDEYRMRAAIILRERACGKKEFVFPYLSPSVYDSLAENAEIIRYPEHTAKRLRFANESFSECIYMHDDVLAVARFVSLLFSEKTPLAEFSEKLPHFGCAEKTVYFTDPKAKLSLIDKYSTSAHSYALSPSDGYEGFTVERELGKITVVPQKGSAVKLFSVAFSTEAAAELCDSLEKEFENLKG